MPEQALIQILIAGTSDDTRSLPRDTLLTLADSHHKAQDLITAATARERAAAPSSAHRQKHPSLHKNPAKRSRKTSCGVRAPK